MVSLDVIADVPNEATFHPLALRRAECIENKKQRANCCDAKDIWLRLVRSPQIDLCQMRGS
jgi:hypothetical protein